MASLSSNNSSWPCTTSKICGARTLRAASASLPTLGHDRRSRERCRESLDTARSVRAPRLSPEFVDRAVVPHRKRHIFKSAMEGIVMADGGPVDAHGIVDGGLDVFRV